MWKNTKEHIEYSSLGNRDWNCFYTYVIIKQTPDGGMYLYDGVASRGELAWNLMEVSQMTWIL